MADPKSNSRLLDSLASTEDAEFIPIWRECSSFTMTSIERGLALFRATRYIVEQRVPGVFVECGVWKGGSVMIAMKTLQMLDAANRRFVLFDTFSGMTEPSAIDQDFRGADAAALLAGSEDDPETKLVKAQASLQEVQANLATVGYDPSKVRFRVGDVRNILKKSNVAAIALLRLDTDFYDSTYAELMYLYPRLVQNGVLIIDDYGHWQGAKKAVDDYFGEIGPAPLPRAPRPYFHWIDYTGRMAIRTDPSPEELPAEIVRDSKLTWGKAERGGVPIPTPDQRYDYRPPGLVDPDLLPRFPSLVASDPRRNKWPYLRLAAPHHWRTDARSVNQQIGVLSLEEAIVLHNLALPYAGRRGLAIGCHFAWSTAHLLAANLHLDVVDPKLSREDQWEGVNESLSSVPTRGSYRLWAAYSPSILPALRETKSEPWSFVFIDGDHEGDAPRLDAQAVLQYCAPTATVVLHDLASPAVTAGLEVFRSAGWNVRIYNTMQIMGVAWRGDVIPVSYPTDPHMPPISEEHLAEYEQ